ncbi:hypothetical protein SDC9_131959 [bioreactor metagenome]|uniref:Uncharacterized protein n=1 Tax=bioreactor metagenome TaxID=1076179 RepID=A0A645D7F9_9ZZZZ
MSCAQETFLERLHVDESLQLNASFNERSIGPFASAISGGFEGGFTTNAGGQVRPDVHSSPGVFFTKGDRGNACVFQFLNVGQELFPGGGSGFDASLSEEVLVVPDGNHAHIPGNTIVFAINCEDIQSTRSEGIFPGATIGFEVCGDVFQQTSLSLLGQTSAAPALEDIRNFTRL